MIHNVNIKKNEIRFIILETICGHIKKLSKDLKILPPSKVLIGSRFNVPKIADEKIKNETALDCVLRISKIMTVKKLKSGPKKESNISCQYEVRMPFVFNLAPRIPKENSVSSILNSFEATICPDS